MAYISQCKGGNCEKKNSCYRFLAKPKEECYVSFPNICHKKNNYKWFWQAKTELVKKGDG